MGRLTTCTACMHALRCGACTALHSCTALHFGAKQEGKKLVGQPTRSVLLLVSLPQLRFPLVSMTITQLLMMMSPPHPEVVWVDALPDGVHRPGEGPGQGVGGQTGQQAVPEVPEAGGEGEGAVPRLRLLPGDRHAVGRAAARGRVASETEHCTTGRHRYASTRTDPESPSSGEYRGKTDIFVDLICDLTGEIGGDVVSTIVQSLLG
jgi:hypothetical protein